MKSFLFGSYCLGIRNPKSAIRNPVGTELLRRRLVFVTALLLCVFVLAGCIVPVPSPDGPADTFGLDFRLPPGSNTSGVMVFFIDGLNGEIFDQLLQAGELPAFRKYFADRGLYTPRAIANLPSVTLANLTSFATGRLPGNHGIVGVNWFDRNQLIWRDYAEIRQKNKLDEDYGAATLFERLGDRTTAAVFFQPHRGATRWIENWTSAGPPFYFGWYEFIDRLTLYRLNMIANIARVRHEFPALTVCYLLAPDFYAYAHGVKSAQYRDAIRHSDRQIGRVLGDLERAGLLDKVHIAVISDHSLGEVSRHCPIRPLLRRMGLDVAHEDLWEKYSFEKRMEYFRRFSTVVYGSGDRYAPISLRRPIRRDGKVVGLEAWPVRPRPEDLRAYPALRPPKPAGLAGLFAPPPQPVEVDLIAELLKEEAVDALAWPAGPEKVRLRRRGGEVEFAAAAGMIRYRVISGSDVLGWKGHVPDDVLAGTRPATGRQWLAWTHPTQFPDLPEQLLAYFRARRAGDLVAFAAEGWDLNSHNRAGHGGLLPSDVAVPVLLAGPRVPHGRLGPVRVIDMSATILELLGKPVPAELDGQSLLGAKK